MKKLYGWGYRKGSLLHDLITWIYIRSDVLKDLNSGIFSAEDIIKKFVLNQHYFIVEKKAVAYLKTHCSKISTEIREEENDESSDNNSADYQTIKRRRRLLGIDEEAKDEA